MDSCGVFEFIKTISFKIYNMNYSLWTDGKLIFDILGLKNHSISAIQILVNAENKYFESQKTKTKNS